MCGFFKRNAWDSRSFFYQLSPCWFLQPEAMGTMFLGQGAWFGAGRVGKGAMASAHPDARHFSLSLYTTGALQAGNLGLELRGSEYD